MAVAPGNLLNRQDIIDIFNEIVRDGLNPPRNGAAWDISNHPWPCPEIGGHPVWGPRNEPSHSVSDLPGGTGTLVQPNVFTVLNNLAKQFAYVRVVSYTYIMLGNMAPPPQSGTATSHVSSGYGNPGAVSASGPAAGSIVTAQQLIDFLNTLRGQINSVRSDSIGTITCTHCHMSCHSACHGSRGRR